MSLVDEPKEHLPVNASVYLCLTRFRSIRHRYFVYKILDYVTAADVAKLKWMLAEIATPHVSAKED
jgi:hypothetical protein